MGANSFTCLIVPSRGSPPDVCESYHADHFRKLEGPCCLWGIAKRSPQFQQQCAAGGQLRYGSTSLGVRRGWRRVAAEKSHAITNDLGYP
jgi:hypothetical protein